MFINSAVSRFPTHPLCRVFPPAEGLKMIRVRNDAHLPSHTDVKDEWIFTSTLPIPHHVMVIRYRNSFLWTQSKKNHYL